ncbi:sensor histidine kinase [Sphaerotilaceae bacterium SBD11-9]
MPTAWACLAAAGDLRVRRWRDVGLVAFATLASYVVAAWLELSERVQAWVAPYEHWQVDELLLSLTVLACGLAWYALRRANEARAHLALREAAEAQARELLLHNRELARQLIAVQESERLALARELHDELGQGCAAVRAETAYIRLCDAADRAATLASVERADRAAQQLYQTVRGMLRRLRPANLDELGLVAALQELCESWEERSGVDCIFHHDAVPDDLGDAVEMALYRVTQEALTNVMRHAHASAVRVLLGRSAQGELLLSVEDDGRGMDLAAATRGLGLLGATERAAALGGDLEVHAVPGEGVRLVLRVPRPPVAGGVPAAVAHKEPA